MNKVSAIIGIFSFAARLICANSARLGLYDSALFIAVFAQPRVLMFPYLFIGPRDRGAGGLGKR